MGVVWPRLFRSGDPPHLLLHCIFIGREGALSLNPSAPRFRQSSFSLDYGPVRLASVFEFVGDLLAELPKFFAGSSGSTGALLSLTLSTVAMWVCWLTMFPTVYATPKGPEYCVGYVDDCCEAVGLPYRPAGGTGASLCPDWGCWFSPVGV